LAAILCLGLATAKDLHHTTLIWQQKNATVPYRFPHLAETVGLVPLMNW
jgi:hypothetical protein